MKNIEKSMSLFAKAGKNYHNKPLLNVFDNKIFHNNENGIKWDSNQSLINFPNNSRVVFDKAQKRNFLNFFSKQNKNQEQSFNNESSFKTNNNTTTTDESNNSSDSNKNENNKGIAFRSFFYFSSKNNIALMNILIYLLICYTFTY